MNRQSTIDNRQSTIDNRQSTTALAIAREDLRARGVPEHLLDVPYNQEFTLEQIRYHADRAAEHLISCGSWTAFLAGYIGRENVGGLLESNGQDVRLIQVAFALYMESNRLLGDGKGKSKKNAPRASLPGFDYIQASFDFDANAPGLTADLAQDVKKLRRERDAAQAEKQVEISRRERAERESQRLILAEDQRRLIARGTNWPLLTDAGEADIAKKLKAQLEYGIAIREIIHGFCDRIREAPSYSHDFKFTVRGMAAALSAHIRAAELDLLSCVGIGDYHDVCIAADEADADCHSHEGGNPDGCGAGVPPAIPSINNRQSTIDNPPMTAVLGGVAGAPPDNSSGVGIPARHSKNSHKKDNP